MGGKLEVTSAVEARNWCKAMCKCTPFDCDEQDYWWDVYLAAGDLLGVWDSQDLPFQTSVEKYIKDIRLDEIKMNAEDALIWITQELAKMGEFWSKRYTDMLDQRNQLIAFLYINNALDQPDVLMFLTRTSTNV